MVKAAASAQAIFEQARIVTEMATQVELFLAGTLSREALLAWAQAASLDRSGIRFHNPHAGILYSCLCSLDAQLDKTREHIVRPSDLAIHLRELRSGLLPLPRDPLPLVAMVKLSPTELARRTGAEVARFWWDGRGFSERVCFTSAGTGVAFSGVSLLVNAQSPVPSTAVHVWESPQSQPERSWLLGVLFDTLCIDDADATRLWAPITTCWDLMRQDDNGNSFSVASFTGYAKARARIAELDAQQHKQLYWLEPRALDNSAK